jgi:hypothetical protein
MHPLGNFCVPYCQKEVFPDMGVLTKYDRIEPIYLPQRYNVYLFTPRKSDCLSVAERTVSC